MDEEKKRVDNFYSPAEIMADLDIGKTKFYQLIKIPGFPVLQIGNQTRIYKGEYEKWLMANKGNKILLPKKKD